MDYKVDFGNGGKTLFIIDNTVYLNADKAATAVKTATSWEDGIVHDWLSALTRISYFKAIDVLRAAVKDLTMKEAVDALRAGGAVTHTAAESEEEDDNS